MPARHVVVDGSNIATEGNSLPTLKQLEEAVGEFIAENPDDTVTVVVDATFGHRIPPEERPRFEQAELDADLVSPPAGAIGRGDAFLLRVADKIGAVVLSNDSFQEFHGEYEWLFDKGRLIGGKPVPGVGWIFTPRIPVRGPKSRESMKEAKRKRRTGDAGEEEPADLAAPERSRARGGSRKLQKAIAVAVEEAVEPSKGGRKRRRRASPEAPAEALNEPLGFISFIASHQLGAEVEGTVEEFASHGAFISAGGARCYLPLSAMGDVPPRSAREVLRKGETRSFVVQAFDAMRRGIELALPGFAHLSGGPTAETVEAEIHRVAEGVPGGKVPLLVGTGPPTGVPRDEDGASRDPSKTRRRGSRGGTRAALDQGEGAGQFGGSVALGSPGASAPAGAPAPRAIRSAKATAAKAPAAKAPAAKATATKATATKATATKASATKATATKASATKATAAKASATKAFATKATATKASATKATATKASAVKVAAKATAVKATAVKATATKALATKATATKAPAAKAPAAKVAATKATKARSK